MTSSEIEPATFRLVAQCLNQLRYHILAVQSWLLRFIYLSNNKLSICQMITSLTLNRELPGSNLGLGPDYGENFHDLLKSIPANIGITNIARFNQIKVTWRVLSSEIKRRLVQWKSTEVSVGYFTTSFKFAVFATCFTMVSCLVYSLTIKIESHVPPKRRLTFSAQHGVIFQQIRLFITIASKTSDHTKITCFASSTHHHQI
jgi:hypothetical protein